jgi:hypothetical protein
LYIVASFPSLVDLFCDFGRSAELQANVKGRPVAILTEQQICFLTSGAVLQSIGVLLDRCYMQRRRT